MSKKISFSKSLSPGQNWKSKSMRIIQEDIVGSNREAFEHRVVLTVRWNNSWQLWLERDKKGLFMIKADWDEFVDDNLLSRDDTLLFTHKDTMYFEVRIFKKDGKEIISASREVEPETQPVHATPLQKSHHETTPVSASASASGRKTRRGRQSCAHVENPERYLLNPRNPYFEKTISKSNYMLSVGSLVVKEYDLKFGPHNSTMYFLLPDGEKLVGFTRSYTGLHCFVGWEAVCQKYNLKVGDTVVCELELSGRVVTGVRVHFVNE